MASGLATHLVGLRIYNLLAIEGAARTAAQLRERLQTYLPDLEQAEVDAALQELVTRNRLTDNAGTYAVTNPATRSPVLWVEPSEDGWAGWQVRDRASRRIAALP